MLFIPLPPFLLLFHHNLSLLPSIIPFGHFIPCIPNVLCDDGTRQMKISAPVQFTSRAGKQDQ